MKKIIFLLLIVFVSVFAYSAEITVAGSGANEIIVKLLADGFVKDNPGNVINVPPSIGTDGAINGVLNAKFEIGRIGRPLKDKEKVPDLKELLFCKIPVVFVVNANVKVTNLTSAQLFDIFSGKITNWKEVGGEDKKIYVITREKGDASLSEIEKNIESFKNIIFTDKAIIAKKDFEVVDRIEEKDGTIGFGTSVTMLGRKAKILQLNGKSYTSADYSIMTTVGLIYMKELKGLAAKFVDYIYSAKGIEIIKKAGCTPLPR